MAKIDLHLHSTCSDGSNTPQELIEKLQQAHIQIFSLTDHDTIQGLSQIEHLLPKHLQFIKGIEFSTQNPLAEAHILGYNFDENNKVFLKTIEKGRQLRQQKLTHRLQYLKEHFNITFNQEDVEALYQLNATAKPHLARVLMKYGYCETISEGIEKYINDCPNENDRIDYREAIEAIHQAGGLALWAHPLGGEHQVHLTKEAFYQQFDMMKKAGIDGLECYYSRYSNQEETFLVSIAQNNHLLISGGSDYHGENKTVKIGCLNKEFQFVDSSSLTLIQHLAEE